MKSINLKVIRFDGGTQSRAALNETTVYEYAEALIDGADLPPVVVFFDGTDHWLADGFHRFHAHRKAERASIQAEIHGGTLTDAKLYSFGANKQHGLRRSTEDKRNAVAGMLELFADWSDNRIAKHVGVDHKTVAAHRAAILGNSQDAPTTRTVERAGKTYEQKTANIGKKAEPILGNSQDAPAEKPADPLLEDFDPLKELEEAQKTIERMTAELAALEADDAKAEVLKWKRVADAAQRRQSELMDAAANSQKREKWTMDQLRRCGKAVGEEDPTRIAKAVERAVKVAA